MTSVVCTNSVGAEHAEGAAEGARHRAPRLAARAPRQESQAQK